MSSPTGKKAVTNDFENFVRTSRASWSKNLGHDHVLTTFSSYGNVSSYRQAEIIRALSAQGDKFHHAT
jgi:hypothetical protein